jgi:hypothetical protein
MSKKSIIVDFQRFLDTEKKAKEALRLSSKHDPDIMKMLNRLIDHVNKQLGVAGKMSIEERISIVERRLDKIGAPKYRRSR